MDAVSRQHLCVGGGGGLGVTVLERQASKSRWTPPCHGVHPGKDLAPGEGPEAGACTFPRLSCALVSWGATGGEGHGGARLTTTEMCSLLVLEGRGLKPRCCSGALLQEAPGQGSSWPSCPWWPWVSRACGHVPPASLPLGGLLHRHFLLHVRHDLCRDP